MSKTTKIKQIPIHNPLFKQLNIYENNLPGSIPQLEGPILKFYEKETSFETEILNSDINKLDEQIREVKDKIGRMKERETKRIKREFHAGLIDRQIFKDGNSYANRYRVTFEILTNALDLNP